jgi:hypothetical protein
LRSRATTISQVLGFGRWVGGTPIQCGNGFEKYRVKKSHHGFAQKMDCLDIRQRSAPKEHNVYSAAFSNQRRSSGAQSVFASWNYMPLLTERDGCGDAEL